jgi:hypothetical protein
MVMSMSESSQDNNRDDPVFGEMSPLVADFLHTDVRDNIYRCLEIVEALEGKKRGEKFYGNLYCLEIEDGEVIIKNVYDNSVAAEKCEILRFAKILRAWHAKLEMECGD